MQEFTASKEKGIQIQNDTYKAYGSFKAGLVLLFLFAGALAFNLLNMADWIAYGCSAANILLHIVLAVLIIAALTGSVFLMRSGGRKYLYRPMEEMKVFNDHIYIHYVPYRKKEHVYVSIYFCDVRKMEYLAGRRCIRIESPAMIRKLSQKKGEEKEDSCEPDKGHYYIYAWYQDYKALLDLIEEKSLRKISGRN